MKFRVTKGMMDLSHLDSTLVEELEAEERARRIQLDQHECADPYERMIADALTDAGISWQYERHPDRANEQGRKLDFKIGEGLYIEVKRAHTDRVNEQLAAAPNVVLIQGRDAIRWFADILRRIK